MAGSGSGGDVGGAVVVAGVSGAGVAVGVAREDFKAAEEGLWASVLSGTCGALSLLLSEADGEAASCGECGGATRRSTRLLTLFGPASVERWHWTCGVCGSRTCPLDAGLGAETGGERLTSALRSVLGWSAAYVSFRGAAEAVRRVAGVSVDAKRLKRSAKALGEALSEQRIDLPQHAQPFERRQIVGLVARSIRMSEGAATEQPPRRARPPQCSRVGCSSHRRYHPILCGEPTDSLCRRPKSLRNGRKKSLRLVHRRPQRGSCVSRSIKQRAPRSNLTTTKEEQRCST